jgi:hypothetical protein
MGSQAFSLIISPFLFIQYLRFFFFKKKKMNKLHLTKQQTKIEEDLDIEMPAVQFDSDVTI